MTRIAIALAARSLSLTLNIGALLTGLIAGGAMWFLLSMGG